MSHDDPSEASAELGRLVDAAAARPEDGELRKRLAWLVELLIARGQLAPGHRALLARIRDDGHRVQLSVVGDKRRVPSADIDCAARLHLCRARCCSFSISLSAEDVAEGKLRWEIERPYLLRRRRGDRLLREPLARARLHRL